jgi:uncharacterized protein
VQVPTLAAAPNGGNTCASLIKTLSYIQIQLDVAVEFTWDARKDRLNRRKHGISFDTAMRIFDDPFQVTEQDREVEHEPRWQTIGTVGQNVLLVVHTVDEESDVIRIISARKATRAERRIYAEGN